MGNDGCLDSFIPQALLGQVSEQVMVDDLELAGEHAASVDVGGVRLDALVVAEDLSGGGSRHGGNQQRVAQAVLLDLFTQLGPVPQLGAGINTPHVKLQNLQNGKGKFKTTDCKIHHLKKLSAFWRCKHCRLNYDFNLCQLL